GGPGGPPPPRGPAAPPATVRSTWRCWTATARASAPARWSAPGRLRPPRPRAGPALPQSPTALARYRAGGSQDRSGPSSRPASSAAAVWAVGWVACRRSVLPRWGGRVGVVLVPEAGGGARTGAQRQPKPL